MTEGSQTDEGVPELADTWAATERHPPVTAEKADTTIMNLRRLAGDGAKSVRNFIPSNLSLSCRSAGFASGLCAFESLWPARRSSNLLEGALSLSRRR